MADILFPLAAAGATIVAIHIGTVAGEGVATGFTGIPTGALSLCATVAFAAVIGTARFPVVFLDLAAAGAAIVAEQTGTAAWERIATGITSIPTRALSLCASITKTAVICTARFSVDFFVLTTSNTAVVTEHCGGVVAQTRVATGLAYVTTRALALRTNVARTSVVTAAGFTVILLGLAATSTCVVTEHTGEIITRNRRTARFSLISTCTFTFHALVTLTAIVSTAGLSVNLLVNANSCIGIAAKHCVALARDGVAAGLSSGGIGA